MEYTKQEEVELNNQLERWKKRQLTAVRQNKIQIRLIMNRRLNIW